MAVKIVELKVAYPGGYALNRQKAHLFAHAAKDYFTAAQIISEQKKDFSGVWLMYVELPLMHMAIELFVKAVVASYDECFNPREQKYQHKTSRIVTDYRYKIPLMDSLISDTAKMDLLVGLEKAWLSVRYAEVVFEYNGEDYELFKVICSQLSDEYENRRNSL